MYSFVGGLNAQFRYFKKLQDFLRMLHVFELKIKFDKQVITKKFHLTAKDKLMYNTTHVHVHKHAHAHVCLAFSTKCTYIYVYMHTVK